MENIERLSSEYKTKLQELTKISNEIYNQLEKYYTNEKLKEFNSFVEFLDDINNICHGCIGKNSFIDYVDKSNIFKK